MSGLTWHIGDTRKVLATLAPGTVDLVLTSPPFLALRSYLPVDHPDKADEIGAEPTPGAFIDTLLDVVEACERLLAPHGSLCFELGDTYCGARGYGSEGSNPLYGERADERWREARTERRFKKADDGWPEAKSLCLIPELFRVALVYGVNPLTGRTTPRWRARNVVRWCRPNPPVGALGDKFRPATSEMVVVCKSRSRYFDLDAVRTPARHPNATHTLGRVSPTRGDARDAPSKPLENNPAGAPPLDWWKPLPDEQAMWDEWYDQFPEQMWEIPTKGYKGSHYAVFPPALCLRPIRAMCPERVCRTCGEPSRRIVDVERVAPADDRQRRTTADVYRLNGHDHPPEVGWQMRHTTLGWTDCGHGGDWRPGLILDPFAGSGTTLDVAHGLGRHATGIDLDARNLELAQDRLGMFGIDVVDHGAVSDAV